jgi:secreted PhoX family phosphatase
MHIFNRKPMDWDARDERIRPAPETVDFDRVVEAAISRRGFLGGVVAFGSGAAAMGLLGTTSARAQEAALSRFGFTPIPIATDFEVHVPEGYTAQVLLRWGDPLFSDVPAFDHATAGTAETQARAAGDNTDGMEMFHSADRNILAVNNEYTNLDVLLPELAQRMAAEAEAKAAAATTEEERAAALDYEVLPASLEDVRKAQAAQGVTIAELVQDAAGQWSVAVDSEFNRRIDHNTPMVLSGPAAGHPLLQTAADPTGTQVLGTLNNCGSGRTPWGTYLTCEENFNGYFGSTDPDFERPEGFARYGIALESGYAYEKFDERFDISKNPNEPHRHGYVVEIDPLDPASTPVKRTALGRFKHENAAVVLARDGRVVVYMGDDERGEFLYKYVSTEPYVPGPNGNKDSLLDEGQLYVARFDADGTGEWVALTPEATGMDRALIHVHTRQAASAVGATTMDRPEWVAVNPLAIEAYCCLTNNSRRKPEATNAGGDPMEAVEGSPNPRAENRYGQIVRWYPANEDHADPSFAWDLYVMAGNPEVHAGTPYAGSPNVTAGNMFNSPDGMMFDSKGLVWIQTDGDDSNEGDFAGMGNNQMLVGDPATGEIARFLTGPNGCEVTGMAFSADRRTVFAGIQHPGGSWPDGEGLPRSAIVAIRRADGAVIA